MRTMLVLTGCVAMNVSAAAAQESRCTLQDDPNRTVNITNRGTNNETWFITDAVLDCDGGRHLVARTATYSVGAGQITLNGAVHVEDPERTLTSEFAQYFVETGQLHARTNVVLTEKANGSVITSELLDAYEESPERPQGLVIATGGSPRAVVFQAPQDTVPVLAPPADSVPPDTIAVPEPAAPIPLGLRPDDPATVERNGIARDSTVLEAREIRIIGEESFRGTGDAVLRRDSLTATGAAIEYSQETRRLDVMVAAHVEMPSQELRGDSITATIDEQDEIRDVLVRRGAQLETEDLDVTAPAILLLFEDGGVSRMIAMHWSTDSTSAAQPRMESEEFRIDADSIDVLAPEQQLTEAIAIGNAHGARALPDSLRALLPEAEPDVLALLGNDWMRGDTVRARFVPNPEAETDTTAAATIMEQLSATGNQAQSMYSIRDENDPEATLSFNYLRSTYIEVNFDGGAVSTVAAAGDARGVYLQPAEAAAATDAAAPPPGGSR